MKLVNIGPLKNVEIEQILKGPGYKIILPKNERWDKQFENVDMKKKNPMMIRITYKKKKYIIPVTRLEILPGYKHYSLLLGNARPEEHYENEYEIDEKNNEIFKKVEEEETEEKPEQ